MSSWDIILTLLYSSLAVFAGFAVVSFKRDDWLYKKYFVKGLLAKLIGGISFGLVYTFYYTYGGDTVAYYRDLTTMMDLLFESPFDYIEVLFSTAEEAEQNYFQLGRKLKFSFGTAEWFTVKFASIAGIFGLNNYFATTIVFSMLSYIGIWRLFQTLAMRYPDITKQLAFATLFVPSVFFWGSGIMKDCIVIGFLGLIIYSADAIINPKRRTAFFKNIFIIMISAYVILNVKAYVIISLMPAVLLWLVLGLRDNISNPLIRNLTVPVLLTVSIVLMSVSITFLGSFNEKYSVDTVLDTAHGMQTWHYKEGENTSAQHGRGSSYTLGEYDPTIAGTLAMFWPSVNVTFFRPYLWEVKNVAMLAASIESTVIMLYTLFIFIGLGFFRVLKIINRDAFLLMALSFALFFGFAVGFTSYNFGALVRYKIPCVPFYLSALFILQYKVRVLKESAKVRSRQRMEQMRRQKAMVAQRFN